MPRAQPDSTDSRNAGRGRSLFAARALFLEIRATCSEKQGPRYDPARQRPAPASEARPTDGTCRNPTRRTKKRSVRFTYYYSARKSSFQALSPVLYRFSGTPVSVLFHAPSRPELPHKPFFFPFIRFLRRFCLFLRRNIQREK